MALIAAGQAVGSALLDPLCERVINAGVEELRLVKNVKKDVRKLMSTASLIRAVLLDAEQRQVKNEAVRIWLTSLKQILYDAEDVLDEIATHDAVRRTSLDANSSRSVISTMAKVRNLIHCFGRKNEFLSRYHVARQIGDIRLKLDDLNKERDQFGLQQLANWPAPRPLDTCSLLFDDSSIVGREDEIKQITQFLLAQSESTSKINDLQFLAIVGMGGVGKTTLTRRIFSDLKIKQHFQLMMWVCISEDFDVKRITREIMDAVTTSDEKKEFKEISNWDSAQKRLKDKIKGKKFLLVLDDVWEEDLSKWEVFYEPLKYGHHGSKIIVTTRNKKISDMLKAFPITLKNLADEDLWNIFKRYAFKGYAFNGQHPTISMQFEILGKQINDRLRGSPLAAKIIGRLLNLNFDVRFWTRVKESENLTLGGHGNDGILPILRVSYDHLLGHSKQCFTYCSLFPKDYMFFGPELVQLWTAQNFFETVRGSHTYKSAYSDQYLSDLCYKSFFEKTDGGFFVMHDLIHDLAELVSKDDCFRQGDEKSKKISETIRHVSVVTSNPDMDELHELCKHDKLRTLLFLQQPIFELSSHLDDLFMKLRRLRVLGLGSCKIKKLPTSIGTLMHLRFIDLSNNLFTELPKSFCNLHNLQVLILDGCESLGSLPSNMSALINLRHLAARCALVSSIPCLRKLTALEEIEVRGTKVRELADMSMLKKVVVHGVEKVANKEEAMHAKLNVKEHLDVLDLEWVHSKYDEHLVNKTLEEEVVEGLEPRNSITQLSIYGYGGIRSPSWLENHTWVSPSFLERVELGNCGNWEVLPPLGQLPCLKRLELRDMPKVRRIGLYFFGCLTPERGGIKAQGGFSSLEELELYDLPEWEEWEVPCGDGGGQDDDQPRQQQSWFFPRLRKLEISNCAKLRELPPLPPTLRELYIYEVGLTHLPEWQGCWVDDSKDTDRVPSLFSLTIRGCPNLVSLDRGFFQHPLPSLETLEVCNCKNLEFLPKGAFRRHLTSLKSLTMVGCPKLSCPPPVVTEEEDDLLPSSLETVTIQGCGNTVEELLLASTQKHSSLSYLDMDVTSSSVGAGLRGMTCLTDLKIKNCSNMPVELPSSLVSLRIDDSHLDEEALSAWLQRLASLKILTIRNCPATTILPIRRVVVDQVPYNPLPALEELKISHCKELTSLAGVNINITLRYLRIEDCPKLFNLVVADATTTRGSTSPSPPQSSPITTMPLMHLERLFIHSSSPQQITLWLRQCPSLRQLHFGSCPQLTCFDDELEAALLTLAPSLRSLRFANCENLRSLPSKFSCLSALETLEIRGCPALREVPDCVEGGALSCIIYNY